MKHNGKKLYLALLIASAFVSTAVFANIPAGNAQSASSSSSDKPQASSAQAPAPSSAAPSSTKPASASTPSTTPAAASSKQTVAQAKAAGMVWVNTESGFYHKPGTRWYGKTKHGKYMLEADAIKAGYKPAK